MKHIGLISFILCAGILFGIRCDSPTSVDQEPSALRFLALGDSYTIGQSVPEHQRWPVQLVDSLRRRNYRLEDAEIIAQTGWTTLDLQIAIQGAQLQGTYDWVSLLIGVNDQYQGRTAEQVRAGFTQLLQRAIEMAGSRFDRVIVLSIPDYSVTPFGRQMDSLRISREIDQFNLINQQISSQANVRYIDITSISRLAADDLSLLANDGLHPSGKMYTAWVERVLPVIEAMKLN